MPTTQMITQDPLATTHTAHSTSQTLQRQSTDLQQLPSFVNLHLQSPSVGSPIHELFGTPKKPPNHSTSRFGALQRQANGIHSIDPPSRVINRYQSDFREGRVLGKGGYGVVFQATNVVGIISEYSLLICLAPFLCT